jgi:hypothetical protein
VIAGYNVSYSSNTFPSNNEDGLWQRAFFIKRKNLMQIVGSTYVYGVVVVVAKPIIF